MDDLLLEIGRRKDSLSKRQRALCAYILEHSLEASMLTIVDLAKNAQVGTATVIRTIQALGFDKYNQFKAALRDAVFARASTSYQTYWDMTASRGNKADNFSAIITFCSECIQSLNNPAYISQIEQAAQRILSAERILILGLRSSYPIALSLEYQLMNYDLNLFQLSARTEYLFDHLAKLKKGDLLLALASPPVAEQTIQALKICKDCEIPSVVFTTTHSELTDSLSDLVISSDGFDTPFSHALCGLSVDFLAVAIGRHLGSTGSHLNHVETMLEKYDLSIWYKGSDLRSTHK